MTRYPAPLLATLIACGSGHGGAQDASTGTDGGSASGNPPVLWLHPTDNDMEMVLTGTMPTSEY